MSRALKDIVFQKAPLLSTDSGSLTSGNYNKLAKAFNDRLNINYGDSNYRIYSNIISLGRNLMRDTNDLPLPIHQFLFATDGEWATYYDINTTIQNRMANLVYGWQRYPPDIGPRDIENINDKLLKYPPTSSGNPIVFATTADYANPATLWSAANTLRGIVKTDGTYLSPSVENKNQWQHIEQNVPNNVYNYSTPSYAPQPAVIGYWDLNTYTPDVPVGTLMPSYQLKFTNIDTPTTIVYYNGTEPNVGNYFLSADWQNYYIYGYTGPNVITTTPTAIYPRTEWVNGIYEGGGVMSQYSNNPLMEWIFTNYTKDHRGPTAAWQQDDYGNEYTFDFQSFFQQQYRLSPNYSSDNWTRQDLTYVATGVVPADTYLVNNINSTDTYAYHTGFSLATYYIHFDSVTSLSTDIVLEIYNGATKIDTLTITKSTAYTYEIVAPCISQPTIKVLLKTAITGGTISVHTDEIETYYPDNMDAYWFLRIASLTSTGVDQYPNLSTDSKRISDDYNTYGLPLPNFNNDIDTGVTLNDFNEITAFRKVLDYI
jgi:hypothetical protein